MKIRKGDNVQILTGKDAGRRGKILEVLPEADRVVVEGLNIRKKHSRGRRAGLWDLDPSPSRINERASAAFHG